MTVTYNRSTQDQDPQESGSQHTLAGALHGGTNQQPGQAGSLPTFADPARRNVANPPVTPLPGARFFGLEHSGQKGPVNKQVPISNGQPLNSGQGGMEQFPTREQPANYRRQELEQLHTAALPGVSRAGNGANGGNQTGRDGEPAVVRNAPGVGFMAYKAPSIDKAQAGSGAESNLEVDKGNIILYRTHNFFLRTAYRPGQRQNPLRRPTGHTTVMPRVLPNQEKRIASSETRVMPNITVNATKQTRGIALPSWMEALMVTVALMGVLVAHAYNMFNFPRYELDEGTYMSNAWAITQGMISPYSYGYGHPPLGWMQIAVWLKLVGGPFAFGNALNTGRVLMLFYAIGSALLVYLIVRRMTGSRIAALLGLAMFSFSPLSITYQRQVFLDNIATFWLLVSLYLLVASNSRLKYIIGGAIAFGVAFLSKETIAVFFPAMIYAAWLYTTKFQRKFGMVAFIYATLGVCSVWILMAVLKGELFPYGWLPWDHHPHLSFIQTFIGQAQRSESNGSFIGSWTIWIENDPVFIIASLAAPAFNLIYGWWNRKHLMLALLLLSYWAFVARGGQTLSFYIIPIIPLTAINVAAAVNTILSWPVKVVRFDVVRVVLLLLAVAVVVPYDIQETSFRFYQSPTSAQEQAMIWVRDHVPHNDFLVVNSYLYLDLRLPGGQGVGDGAPFPHAEVYWNVAYDPDVNQKALEGNWDRIDYIVADSEMITDFQTFSPDNIVNQAMAHAIPLVQFSANDHTDKIVVTIYKVIHKFAPPTVMSGQQSGAIATSQPYEPTLSSGSARGDPVAINKQRWLAPMA